MCIAESESVGWICCYPPHPHVLRLAGTLWSGYSDERIWRWMPRTRQGFFPVDRSGSNNSFECWNQLCVAQHLCNAAWIPNKPSLVLSTDPASSRLGCFVVILDEKRDSYRGFRCCPSQRFAVYYKCNVHFFSVKTDVDVLFHTTHLESSFFLLKKTSYSCWNSNRTLKYSVLKG